MSRYHNPIYWFLALSLGLHIALLETGVCSLKKPVPPVRVHRLKLTASRSSINKLGGAAPAPDATPPPQTRPQVKKALHPQPRKIRKILSPAPPKPRVRPLPKSKSPILSQSGSAPGSGLAPTAGRGIPGGRGRGSHGPPGLPGQGPSRGATNAERRYLGRIRARLQQYKKYPALSRQRGHEGVVRVSFTLAPSGTLMGGVRIVSSSGHHLLDRQARECVLAAAPFPPFPPTLHKTRLTIIVPIAFRLTHGDS